MSAEMDHPDDALILALASGSSWRQAAKLVGIGQATVGRRMKDTAFRALVTERRAALLDEAAGRLVGLMRQASATLKSLLGSQSDAVRLGAARCVLDAAVSIQSVIAFERRLSELEGKT